jgi:ribosome-binding ATPase YchF (GTP1/OBG family)
VKSVREVAANEGSECVVICAQLEADLVDLSPTERVEYLESLGVRSSGVDQLIKSAYHVLGLMSFLTAGEKEARAWTIPQGSARKTRRAQFTRTLRVVLFALKLSATTI